MMNGLLTKEDKKSKKKNSKQKLPKEISQEILKKIFRNLLKAIGIMLYFIILNLAYSTMNQERLIGDIEVFAGTFLVFGLIFLEIAYKKDNGSNAVSGIEFLVLSLHSLSIMHVITLFKYDFRFYLLTSSYIFSIYYVLKSIVLYTKGRKEYLSSLSDISEIVKKDEPMKKEAKKQNSDDEIKKEEKIEEPKATKKKVTLKPRTKTKKEEKTKETKNTKKKTTSKPKPKKEKEEKPKKPEITKKKTTSKSTSKTVKEDTEEIKTPEKKKRGRPKKEVIKND